MHLRASILTVATISGFLATAAAFGTAWSQPGTLLSYTKINSASLPGALDDGDEFGDSVANLGDLDGTGPSVVALAVGAIGDDDGGQHRGAVYILFLDAAGSVLSYQKISATQGGFVGTLDQGDELGGAVASLGDLDGSGPSAITLAVGAIGDDDGGSNRGAVYLLFLNSAGTVLSQQKIGSGLGGFTGALDNLDEFGGALTSLGDLDGAGPSVAALAVGAVYDDDGGADRGAVYVLFLNSAGSVLSHQKISSTQGNFSGNVGNSDNFGEDVVNLGDLDGAGSSIRALAVGSVGDNDGGSEKGAVFVVFLNSAGSVLSHQKISSTQGNFAGPLQSHDNFGTAVTNLGDLDGAGPSVTTLAVGAGADAGLGTERGAVYNLLLDATGKVLSYQEISSTAGGFATVLDDLDEFGSGLAALGDIDGAGGGAQTVAVGVAFDDDGGLDRGAVYLLSLAGSSLVGVDDPRARAHGEGLGPARPNSFSQRTTITFRILSAGHVRIEAWDVAGRLARRLVDQPTGPGEHQVVWDGLDDAGRPLPSGTYLLRMSLDGRTVTRAARAVLVR